MDTIDPAMTTQLAASQQGNQIATLMLKKSQDLQAQQVQGLVQSASVPGQGQKIDVTA